MIYKLHIYSKSMGCKDFFSTENENISIIDHKFGGDYEKYIEQWANNKISGNLLNENKERIGGVTKNLVRFNPS